MGQKYLSANTSINGKQGKLPSLYNKLTFPAGGIVIDYGCGSVTDLLEEKAKADGAEWYGYDLTWKPDLETLDKLNEGVDLSVCCNVLNVIDDEETIKEIITNLVTHSKQTIFQVYTGNGDGIGTPTQNNQSWQRNDNRKWYENLIKELGYKVTRAVENYIYCKEA